MAAVCYGSHKDRKRHGSRLYLMLAAALAAAFCIGGIFAYYTDRQALTNTITAGQNTTKIVEEFDPTPQDDVYKKAVRIENTGDIPCYVRVYLAFSDEEVTGISKLSSDGKTYYGMADYVKNLPSGWVHGSDGYFYYTKALKPGEKTEYLMKNVKTTWKADMDRHGFELIVREESVQLPANDPGADYKASWAEFHAGEVN